MADFNYYLNRVGVRGPKGEQGEQGFSPIITVATNTLSEYILQIQTQNNTFLTANLREHKDDLGGTYIRYNRETGVMYAGEADTATTQNLGEVRFATATELERNDGSTVVTPADVNTLINAKGYDDAIEAVDDKADANADNIATNTGNITTLQGQMAGVLGNYVTTNTPQSITGMKTFTNGVRCLTLRDTSGTPYISFSPSSQNRYLLISDNTDFEKNVNVKGNLTTFRNNESNIVVDSGNISDYVGNGTITFTQGGVTKGTMTTNQSGDTTIALDAGGGSSYTEGLGIDITNDVISVDSNVVALQTDLPNMNNYYNTTQIDLMLNEKADVSDISNMVTTDTTQTITGRKTFESFFVRDVARVTTLNGGMIDARTSVNGSILDLYTADTSRHARIEVAGTGSSSIFVLEAPYPSSEFKLNYGANATTVTIEGTNINTVRNNQTYANIDSGNIETYALTSSNISTNAYIQALEARIAALEANINGGNAASA